MANAVYEGTDAVMLSAETAAGSYPVEAVTIMERIIMRAERDPAFNRTLRVEETIPEATEADAITAAARQAAETIGAAAIVTYTSSGDTTLRAARERPAVPSGNLLVAGMFGHVQHVTRAEYAQREALLARHASSLSASLGPSAKVSDAATDPNIACQLHLIAL